MRRSNRNVVVALASALALAACDGSVGGGPAGPSGSGGGPGGVGGGGGSGGGGGGGGGGGASCAADQLALGSAPVRRLSNAEYVHTLRDLFPGVRVDLPELPPDTRAGGFENDARALGASDLRVARWEDIAFRYGEALTQSASTLAGFLPCASSAVDEASERACGETLVREFGLRAMRRPLTDDELARYRQLFESFRAEIDFEAAVQLTVAAMLQSPTFLYRIEEVVEPGAAPQPLDGYEMASRLSYFLWESMPDDALFEAAERGELATPEQIDAQARRMLEDPRARDAVVDFHRQWLDFERIQIDEHQRRVEDLYPTWNEQLRQSIAEEQSRFVEGVLFDGEGTLSALLTSTRGYVNRSLAELYGVEGPADDSTWIETELPAEERAGILTRAGFLAAHSHTGQGSPILRGLFVTERLLCEQRPSPPPDANVGPVMSEGGEGPRTNRDLFEERTAAPTCQGCHMRIDGFGFGFEHYDAIGAFRTLDNGLPVDASGNVLGTDVDGPYVGAIELSEVLAQSEVVSDCATRQWVRYALGRAPERGESCLVDRLADEFSSSGGDVRELLVDIVTSPEFRHRGLAVAGE